MQSKKTCFFDFISERKYLRRQQKVQISEQKCKVKNVFFEILDKLKMLKKLAYTEFYLYLCTRKNVTFSARVYIIKVNNKTKTI